MQELCGAIDPQVFCRLKPFVSCMELNVSAAEPLLVIVTANGAELVFTVALKVAINGCTDGQPAACYAHFRKVL